MRYGAYMSARLTTKEARPRPRYVVWEITLKCDLACRHCGSRAGRARAAELTLDECRDLAQQLADMGAEEVTLIGGEAYLAPHWLGVVRAVAAATAGAPCKEAACILLMLGGAAAEVADGATDGCNGRLRGAAQLSTPGSLGGSHWLRAALHLVEESH